MLKKVLSAVLVATLLLSVGCGQKPAAPAPAPSSAAPAASSEAAPAPSSEAATPAAPAASADDGKTYVLRMACAATYPSQPNMFMREYKEKIEAATNGKIKVELFEAGAFGGPNEMIQGLQSGAMQTVVIPVGFYATIAPKSTMLDLPFMFANPDEYYHALNDATPSLDAYFETQGLVNVAWVYESNRDILTLKPVTKFEDLKGLNIRTYSSPVSQAEIKAYGANPVIMSTGDVPLALQQKTIDGIQSGNTLLAPAKYFDLAKNFLTDCGTPVPIPCMMSKKFLDELPADLRDTVVNTAKELVTTTSYEYSKKYVEDCYKQMADGGCTVTSCPPEMLEKMKAATAGITGDFLKNNPDMQAAYDEIQKNIETYRAKK